MFLWSFYPRTLFFINETPKKHYLTRKHAFWAINGRDQSYGVIWTREEEYKKNKSKPKFVIFANSLFVVPCQPNFACGVVSRILSFLVSSFIKIGCKMWGCGKSKFHWLGTSLIAYNSLLLPHKPGLSQIKWSVTSTRRYLASIN